ncbi:hypothetical protein AB4581_11415 [Vibrio cyclitrophicus]
MTQVISETELMIMTFSHLVYASLELKTREPTKQERGVFTKHGEEQSNNSTDSTHWVFFKFEGTNTLEFGGKSCKSNMIVGIVR